MCMRTTLTLDHDVAAAVERLRREQGLGLSEAVNRLVRKGMTAPGEHSPYRHETRPLGLKIDVTDIGAVLDLLDQG